MSLCIPYISLCCSLTSLISLFFAPNVLRVYYAPRTYAKDGKALVGCFFSLKFSRTSKRRRAQSLAKAKRQLRAATFACLISFYWEGWLPNICHALGSHGHPRLNNYRLEVRHDVGMLLHLSVQFHVGCRLHAPPTRAYTGYPSYLMPPENSTYHIKLPTWALLLFSPCLGYPGEGPKLGFVTINTTSCSKHRYDLIALPSCDSNPVQIVFMQETRLSAKGCAELTPFLKREGWEIRVGYQPPVKRLRSQFTSCRQPHGGLATLYRKDVTVIEVALSADWASLVPHCQMLWCSCQGGGFYVINCYLPAGADKRSERCLLLDRIFELAGSYSNFPCFVLGDFQDEPGAYPSIQRAFLTGEWVDLYANQQNALQRSLEASFAKNGWKTGYEVGPGKTRIDYVLCNRKATFLFQSIRYLRGQSFPGHTPVHCSLNCDVFNELVWHLKPHPKWRLPDKPTSREQWSQREAICQPILRQHIERLLQAATARDAEVTWSIACRIATDMLNAISQQSIPPTRGKVPEFRKMPLVPDTTSPCRFSKAHKIVRCKSLLKELLFRANHWPEQPKYCWLVDLHNTVRNLRTCCSHIGLPCTAQTDCCVSLDASVRDMMVAVQQFEDNLLRNARNAHLSQWKAKLRISSRTDKKEVHRWLKGYGTGPPKMFVSPEGGLVASPSVMLQMIEDRMQTIYNHHAEVDPRDAFEAFQLKYGSAMGSLYRSADLPKLTHQDLFQLFQKRSPDKASGLDGWATRELLQLPPCGWVGFCFCMQIAEATGDWPQVLKMIAVSSIAKKPLVASPEDTRAIGVSSAVYSVWSSLRFKQLATWMNQICPGNRLGGLAHRTADTSEVDLSLALHDPDSHFDLIAVFIDRWKCFDLILPYVALNVAAQLGLPDQIFRAVLGFYGGQCKFFKLGNVYGKRVMCTNSAVQGCSMSILMINCMYAVLSRQLNTVCPSIKFSTFLDDSKIWTRTSDTNALVDAFKAIHEFDTGVGQVLNDEKTIVATRRKRNANRFLLKVGRACKAKKQAKSLGYSHQFDKRHSPKLQDERVDKAKVAMLKISQLPLSPEMKAIHVHANGHSKWVYGTEIQGPSRNALAKLRTATAKVFVKKANNMRCPFLLFATLQDPWLDPFAKWVQHVALKLRRLAYLKPELLRKILSQVREDARNRPAPKHNVANGVVSVVAYLFFALGWKVGDPNAFNLVLSDGRIISLKAGSKDAFLEELARDVRKYLLNQSPFRYDNPTPGQYGTPDVYLTRFLLDTTFAKDDDFQFLRGYLDKLPPNIHYTRGIFVIASIWVCLQRTSL